MSVTAPGERAGVSRSVAPLDITHVSGGPLARLREVVTTQPDAVAVTDESGPLTYGELAGRSAAVLRAVQETARSPLEPVAMLRSHDADAVATVHGVLASGHPLLVLDTRTPAPRLRRLAERAGARLCISDAAHAAAAREFAERVVDPGDVESLAGSATLAPDLLWELSPAPGTAGTLTFTSGSTGEPKVVESDHRHLVRDAWVNSTGTGCYGADDVVAHTLPMAFSAGLLATVAGPLVGTTLALYDVRGAGIDGLATWLHESGATVMHASPAILRAFVGTSPAPRLLAGLRSLTIAGETAHGRDVEAARRLLPAGCTIRNRYGSSETGLIAEYAVRPGDPPVQGPLPVGSGVGDTVIGLIGDDGAPVPPGGPGTVTVTTRHMATRYAGNPEATAAAFGDNSDGTRTYRTSDIGRLDAEGQLHLLGRRDHSVKIRGYLVEPGEVDAALFDVPDVREALTVGLPRPGDGRTRLVSYVVSSAERPAAAAIRSALHEALPAYMVPESIVFLPALPRTERGKLDRSALPEPPAAAGPKPGEREPTEWEHLVSLAWAKVLSLDEIGLDDDFFELGGDSLAAESLLSLLASDLGVPADNVSTAMLVQAPTLTQFAARVRRGPLPGGNVLVPIRPAGTEPPLFLVAGAGGIGLYFVPLARRLPPEQPVWGLQAYGLEQRAVPDWSVSAAARRNLRAIRRVQRSGPYYLGGHSFGGLIALEMAHHLRQAGEEVALLVVLDSFPPDPMLHFDVQRVPLPQRLRRFARLATTGLREPGPDQFWRFYEQGDFLQRRFRTAPYPGETVVVLGDTAERARRAQWGPHLTGPWRLVSVPGDHQTMLREPYVAETAAAVQEALEQSRRTDR